MKIEFVNHASTVFDHDGVRLITDPWIEGEVFQEGWSLITPSKFTFEDFHSITHIWFSHEHPDHFFPPNIAKIPAEAKSKITVLYHLTADKKVIEFCKKAGFKEVIELSPNKHLELTPNFKVMNTPFGHDSWLLIETEKEKILNTNDCVMNTLPKIAPVAETVGEIDVLLTQFSYACKYGNVNQPEAREEAAKKKYEQIQLQFDTFKPKVFIPMASFVWFSHEENFYMNDSINKIDAVEAFTEEQGIQAVVMYPGDSWKIGDDYDNKKSVEKYLKDYDQISIENTRKTVSVEYNNLEVSANKLVKQLKEEDKLARFLIARYPIKVFLPDVGYAVYFSAKSGLKKIDATPKEVNLIMTSEVLNYCFKFNWGFGTTHVNARFQTVGPNDLKLFNYYVSVTDSLNHQDSTAKRVLRKIGRKIGLVKK